MMESPRAVPRRTQWLNACAGRDFALALAIAEDLLARNPADAVVRRHTARLLDARGDEAAALVHWTYLRNQDAGDFEAACRIAEALRAAGQATGTAIASAAPSANDTFRHAMAGALDAALPVRGADFRHIAICGAAFCGSTLIDRMLGGLPGVKSIGESHWLTKVRRDAGYGPADLAEPLAAQRWVPCTVCGARCAVLTPAFRLALAGDNRGWYHKVAAHLDTAILVSADKNVPMLLDKDPLLDLSALVVFKSPRQAWRSKLDKLPKDRDAAFYESECAAYMQVWTQNYRARFFDSFRPVGEVVWLNFDAFTRDPEPLLRAVCERLDLPFDAGVLHRTVPGHAIGGNAGSMRRLREKDYAVVVEPLPDPALEPAHAAIVDGHAEAQAIFADMMARHEALTASATV